MRVGDAQVRVCVTFAADRDAQVRVDVSFAAGCDAQWRANVNSTPLLPFAALPTTSFVEPQRSGETEDFFPPFSFLLLFFVAKHHSQHTLCEAQIILISIGNNENNF